MRKSKMSECLTAFATSVFVRVRRLGDSMYARAVRSEMKTGEQACQLRVRDLNPRLEMWRPTLTRLFEDDGDL